MCLEPWWVANVCMLKSKLQVVAFAGSGSGYGIIVVTDTH